jgi:hypothetical protein
MRFPGGHPPEPPGRGRCALCTPGSASYSQLMEPRTKPTYGLGAGAVVQYGARIAELFYG